MPNRTEQRQGFEYLADWESAKVLSLDAQIHDLAMKRAALAGKRAKIMRRGYQRQRDKDESRQDQKAGQ